MCFWMTLYSGQGGRKRECEPSQMYPKICYNMSMKNNALILTCVGAWIGLTGCTAMQPDTPSSSTPPNAVMAMVNAHHLIQADEAYVAYRRTHPQGSKELPGMMVALIKGHMLQSQYLLARFYCDEYLRDFPTGSARGEVAYLRIKAAFFRQEQTHSEREATQARAEAHRYLTAHGLTLYTSRVKALLERLRQRENARFEKLAQYYEGRGKPKAAAFYRAKIRKN